MKTAKVTRILHSQGLHQAKFDRLTQIAALCGRVRADVWQRCSGLSTAQQSAYEIRNAWMAEGYDWHGLPARLGKATLSDALGDVQAGREAAKVSVKKAIWHRTRGDGEERHRLYPLLKRNRWDEDSFLHRQMRKLWKGGTSHCTNQIVADAGSYTTKDWHGRAWIYLQGLEHGQRLAIPLRGTHLPTGTLRIILQDDGQVAIHYAIDETAVCSTKPCGDGELGVDKGYTEAYADNIRRNNLGNQKWDRRQKKHTAQTRDFLCHAAHRVVDRAGTIACEDLTAPMSSSKYRHRDTNRRLSGWVKGIMADTFTSISRRRGLALVLVNPAYTSQIDSRTGLLQGTRRGDRFYGLDGVVLDADTNAARNILQRLYDDGITLYTPYREVKRLLRDRSGTPDGTAHPGLEPARQLALPCPAESELPDLVCQELTRIKEQ